MAWTPAAFRTGKFQTVPFLIVLFFVGLAVWDAAVAASHAEKTSEERPVVRFVQFNGVDSLSPSEIKKIMKTREKRFRWFGGSPLDPEVLEEDLRRIERYYQSQGFYEARVVSHKLTPLVGGEVILEIAIEEGDPLVVSSVRLTINGQTTGPWHDDVMALMPLKPGDRFTTSGYRDIEKVLLRFFAEWGYPKTEVSLKARLDKGAHRAEVEAAVNTGAVCRFGPVTIEGNHRVDDAIILRELTFREGDRFKASKIQESQKRLFDLRLFQFVDLQVKGLEGEQTDLPIHILVKEAKKQTVRFGVGYGSEDRLRAQLGHEIRNFLGDARSLQLNAKASSLVQLVEGRFIQPYPLSLRNTSFVATGGVTREDQEAFENEKIYVSSQLDHGLFDRVQVHVGHRLEMNRLLDVSAVAADDDVDQEREEYYISSIFGGLSYRVLDDPLNPTRGVQFINTAEWGSRGLGSEVDFVKLTLEGRGYVPLERFGVMALRLRWGGIRELEDTSRVPVFKRFFSGGSNSVRGYPYQQLGPLDRDGDPYGGLTLVEGNADWRFPIRNSWEGVLFFDFGNVYKQSYEIVMDELKYTVGGGLRYQTPIGPVRLDVGYQLNPPDDPPFNRYQIHVSIGQAF